MERLDEFESETLAIVEERNMGLSNFGTLAASLAGTFFCFITAGGVTGTVICWINGLNRPAAVNPRRHLGLFVTIGMAAGFAAAAIFLRFGWSTPSCDWVLVASLGGLVGIGELASRYRDEPTKALLSIPAIIYVLLNAGAAVMALALGRAFIWKNPPASPVDWMQILTAGLGAMVVLRSSVFRVKVGEQSVDIGPSSFLQSVIDVADRAVDRIRAQERAWTVANLMLDVDPDKVFNLLPSYLPYLMQNLTENDRKKFGDEVKEIDKTRADIGALRLGLLVMNYTGAGVLKAALASIYKQIQVAKEAENTANAAERAESAATDLKTKVEETKAATEAVARAASQIPGTSSEVKEAAQQLAEAATATHFIAAEVSDKIKKTRRHAKSTETLAKSAGRSALQNGSGAADRNLQSGPYV